MTRENSNNRYIDINKTVRFRILILLIFLPMILVVLSGSATAGTITLSEGQNINDAIDAASPGDTIKLSNGEYTPNYDVEIDKDITISGESKEDTVINGGKYFDIDIEGKSATIEDITFGYIFSFRATTSKDNPNQEIILDNVDINDVQNEVLHVDPPTDSRAGDSLNITIKSTEMRGFRDTGILIRTVAPTKDMSVGSVRIKDSNFHSDYEGVTSATINIGGAEKVTIGGVNIDTANNDGINIGNVRTASVSKAKIKGGKNGIEISNVRDMKLKDSSISGIEHRGIDYSSYESNEYIDKLIIQNTSIKDAKERSLVRILGENNADVHIEDVYLNESGNEGLAISNTANLKISNTYVKNSDTGIDLGGNVNDGVSISRSSIKQNQRGIIIEDDATGQHVDVTRSIITDNDERNISNPSPVPMRISKSIIGSPSNEIQTFSEDNIDISDEVYTKEDAPSSLDVGPKSNINKGPESSLVSGDTIPLVGVGVVSIVVVLLLVLFVRIKR